MKPLVYQIVLGSTNKWIDECVSSVASYASRMGYDYECSRELGEYESVIFSEDEKKNYRMVSEWMRLDKLVSRPYVCYVDWDVKIRDDFELGEDIITIDTMDTLLYFGKHIDIAKRVYDECRRRYWEKPENGFAHFVMKDEIEGWQKYVLNVKYWEHLIWHLTGGNVYR